MNLYDYFEYHRSRRRNNFCLRLAQGSPGGRFCTMFAFHGVEDPNLLHVTHKYFGEGSATKEKIIKALEEHFAERPFEAFRPSFTTLAHFGEAKDYRVLLPDDPAPFLHDLKAKLDGVEADKWPEYKPHVTVGRNTDELHLPVRDYVLMDDHKVVWSAAAKGHKMKDEIRRTFARS